MILFSGNLRPTSIPFLKWKFSKVRNVLSRFTKGHLGAAHFSLCKWVRIRLSAMLYSAICFFQELLSLKKCICWKQAKNLSHREHRVHLSVIFITLWRRRRSEVFTPRGLRVRLQLNAHATQCILRRLLSRKFKRTKARVQKILGLSSNALVFFIINVSF